MNDRPVRASLVDVFENFFGEGVERLAPASVEGLAPERQRELVELLDMHLDAAAGDEFHEDVVLLDSMSDPVIIVDDPSEPMTTRRAKQVALYHTEVVIPMQPLWIDYDLVGPKYVAALLQWCRVHHPLLRGHVLSFIRTPRLELDEDSEREVLELLRAEVRRAENAVLKPLVEFEPDEVVGDALETALSVMLRDLGRAAMLGRGISFLDREGGELAGTVADLVRRSEALKELSMARVLERLALPAIDQLPNQDFVEIRLQSEDFEEFRGVLGRAVAKTQEEAAAGKDWQAAFRSNLDEPRWRAELLRRELKDKALRKFMHDKSQGYVVSALSSATFAVASGLATGQIDPAFIAAQFGVSVPLSTLLALLFRQSTARKERLLRFYNVLLHDPV